MSTYIQDPSTLSLQNFETYYIRNHMIISKSGKVAQVGVISKTYLTDNFKIINTYLFQTLKYFYLDFSKEMSSFKVECVCVWGGDSNKKYTFNPWIYVFATNLAAKISDDSRIPNDSG